MRVAIDLRLFEILSESRDCLTANSLAKQSGAEELLVIHILRVLSAIGFVREIGPQNFVATPISRAMTNHSLQAMVRTVSDNTAIVLQQFPNYLRETGYKCPTDALQCPLQWTFKTNLNYYDWLAAHPEQEKDLALSMKIQTKATSI